MGITLELGGLFDNFTALKELAAVKGLPPKVGYRFGKLLGEIEVHLTAYNTAKLKLFQEHGKFVSETRGWEVSKDSETFPEFEKLLGELDKEPVELLKIDGPIQLSDLGEKMDPSPSPQMYHQLSWLIVDGGS